MSKTKENNSKNEKPTKYEYIFEDADSRSVWKYDLSKTKNGPVSTETTYKASYLKELEMRRKRGR